MQAGGIRCAIPPYLKLLEQRQQEQFAEQPLQGQRFGAVMGGINRRATPGQAHGARIGVEDPQRGPAVLDLRLDVETHDSPLHGPGLI
jgi:hypothetical protein